EIERVILGQVATARMWLRAVHVTRLIYALEPRNAVFLIELRALGEVGDAVEILQLKEIRSAFSPGRYDLRGDNLRESSAGQILSEIFQRRRLYSKHVSDHVIANRQGTVFQESFLSYRFNLGRRIEGEAGRCGAQHADPGNLDLKARF